MTKTLNIEVPEEIADHLYSVVDEYIRAVSTYRPFVSGHEAYGVMMQIVREYETQLFNNPTERSQYDTAHACHQIAAMALRHLTDCCSPQSDSSKFRLNAEFLSLNPSDNCLLCKQVLNKLIICISCDERIESGHLSNCPRHSDLLDHEDHEIKILKD